jgi:hypothetical protein
VSVWSISGIDTYRSTVINKTFRPRVSEFVLTTSERVRVKEILKRDDGRLEAFDVTGHVGVSLIK